MRLQWITKSRPKEQVAWPLKIRVSCSSLTQEFLGPRHQTFFKAAAKSDTNLSTVASTNALAKLAPEAARL
jgi:hypothetical protein